MDITYDVFGKWWETELARIKTSNTWLNESFNALNASITGLGGSISGIKADFTVLSAGVTAVKLDEKGISVFGQQVKKWPWADALEARVTGQAALIKDLTQWNTKNLPVIQGLQQSHVTLTHEMGLLEQDVMRDQALIDIAGKKQAEAEEKRLKATKTLGKSKPAASSAATRAEAEAAEAAKQAQAAEERIKQNQIEIRGLRRLADRDEAAIKAAVAEGQEKYRDVSKLRTRSKAEIDLLAKDFAGMEKSVNAASKTLSGLP